MHNLVIKISNILKDRKHDFYILQIIKQNINITEH